MTFLLLLTTGPRTAAVETVRELARSACLQGHRVEVFLAGDGVCHAATLGGEISVTLCDADLRLRQGSSGEMAGVRRGSLSDLARQCRDADRVLVFS